MYIEIFDPSVTTRDVNTKGGKVAFREQQGVAVLGEHHMVPVRVSVPRDGAPYGKGRYVLDDSSFGVGRFGELTITQLRLKPLVATASQRTG